MKKLILIALAITLVGCAAKPNPDLSQADIQYCMFYPIGPHAKDPKTLMVYQRCTKVDLKHFENSINEKYKKSL